MTRETDQETFDAATAGDYAAISSKLHDWAAKTEDFLQLAYWEADYDSIEDAAKEMRALARALNGDHPKDPA